eukprot:COSAG05_NODE_33_length_28089_cov_31.909289_27_plen_110_part_00
MEIEAGTAVPVLISGSRNLAVSWPHSVFSAAIWGGPPQPAASCPTRRQVGGAGAGPAASAAQRQPAAAIRCFSLGSYEYYYSCSRILPRYSTGTALPRYCVSASRESTR